jgi:hypothetical protein
MDFGNVRRDDWVIVGLAFLLFIDLVGLPWFSGYPLDLVGTTTSFTATDGPDAWLGVLGVLATLAVLADISIDRLAPDADLPSINGSRAMTRFALAAAAATVLTLKFLLHLGHFGDLGFGFWAAAALAAGLVYVTRGERIAERSPQMSR